MKKIKNAFKSKWVKVTVSAVAVVLVVGIAVILLGRPNAGAAGLQEQKTITLNKTDITQTISVSGVVQSAQTKNIYSTQSYPVKEIYVKVGDKVKVGDILAELDMSKLENDISQTEINLSSAEKSAEEEKRTNGNSITNAQTSLESSQINLSKQQLSTANAEKDLRDAEAKIAEEFDSYTYDKAIEDARISLERKTTDLEKAQKDLNDAIYNFDDYTYQNNINEAWITLNRKRDSLDDAQNGTVKSYDDFSYQNAVYEAEKAYKRARDDYNDNADPDKEITLKRARDDAADRLDKAQIDLNNYYSKNADSQSDTVESAEKALDDAQRSYNKAVSDLERAKSDAIDNANDKLTSAQNAYNDAQRSYEKALSDKTRAIDDAADSNETKLENAQKTYNDSQKQLQSSQNSLKSAKNSLSQAQSKPTTSESNVELQELNLEKLNNQLAEGKIVATADGVVTEINVKVGAVPNGILFVIEDTGNLHVSANVKEYNLASIELGQSAVITADATGDKVYEGKVSYISPKAVSAAGSTSVEFEIQADIKNSDSIIKIGMNAFLNVITDSKSDVYVAPLSIIVTRGRDSFVYTMADGEKKEIPVTVGIKTSTTAEISGNGLYDGMELLADPEGLLSEEGTRPNMMFGGMGG